MASGQRFEENRDFLEKISKVSQRKIKVILKSCSEEEVKTIVELFINIDCFVQTNKEQKPFKRFRKIISKLLNKKWTRVTVRKFLVKHSKLVSILVASFLAKLIEGLICSALNDG